VATPRHVFRSLGGFAADHPSTLSIDYCLRLREEGYGVYFQPGTVAVLLDRETSVVTTSNGR
jgi:GT2 family glycosyltransferase